jgi:hypothetical protein
LTDNAKKSIFRDAGGAGKGDRPRSYSTKEWDDRWDKIFGNKEEVAREESGSIHPSKNERGKSNDE